METKTLDNGLTLQRTGPFSFNATDKRGGMEFKGEITLLRNRKWHVRTSVHPTQAYNTETVDEAMERVNENHQLWLAANKELVDLQSAFDAAWLRIADEE